MRIEVVEHARRIDAGGLGRGSSLRRRPPRRGNGGKGVFVSLDGPGVCALDDTIGTTYFQQANDGERVARAHLRFPADPAADYRRCRGTPCFTLEPLFKLGIGGCALALDDRRGRLLGSRAGRGGLHAGGAGGKCGGTGHRRRVPAGHRLRVVPGAGHAERTNVAVTFPLEQTVFTLAPHQRGARLESCLHLDARLIGIDRRAIPDLYIVHQTRHKGPAGFSN